MSWDVPVSTQEVDSWCTPASPAINTVVAGSSTAAICKAWDGIYSSYPFTPNSVTSSAVCNDLAPTWIYEINPSTIDTKLVKITIDSKTNTINLKPMNTGSGTFVATLTVTGWLPSGNSVSWTFDITITPCFNTLLTPPTLINQDYLVYDP